MTKDILTRIERQSMLAAGDKAGAYLDSIGKTDLAQLTAEEWEAFLAHAFNAFGDEMRTRIGAEKAPF
jgi:hypothetical protein